MTNSVAFIEEENLSMAWAKAFFTAMECTGGQICPLVVKVTGFSNGIVFEETTIRRELSRRLIENGESPIETVASTIFPKSLWNPNRERHLLYNRYTRCWPRIARCPANRRGTYFQRLIAFDHGNETVNQLEHIIETWQRGNHRHSALQAAVFDPRKDHKHSRQLGFPCLQQVAFNALGPNGEDGLGITGFYATQHLFEKAYGNYLGLCWLGQFMAHEMSLELKQMICVASAAKLGYKSKESLWHLEQQLRDSITAIE